MDSPKINETSIVVEKIDIKQLKNREKIILRNLQLNRSLNSGYWSKLAKEDRKHLVNAIGSMNIDVLNKMPFTLCVTNVITFLRKKAPKINSRDLNNLLLCPPKSMPLVRKLRILPLGNLVTFSLQYTEDDFINIAVPHERALILQNNSEENLIRLIERYNFLPNSPNYFWSITPDAYKALTTNAKDISEIIEGFASPFNNNIELYCSLYKSDKNFGSIGNFFDTILLRGMENQSVEDFSVRRWIINPPFTNNILSMVHDAIMVRLNTFPDDEYYFLLPDWPSHKLIELLQLRGKVVVLESGKYKLYNHLVGEYIFPPISMIFAYMGPTIFQENETFDIALNFLIRE